MVRSPLPFPLLLLFLLALLTGCSPAGKGAEAPEVTSILPEAPPQAEGITEDPPPQEEPPEETPEEAPPEEISEEAPEEPLSRAQALLEEMTLREMVGQLFLIRPDALHLELTVDQLENTYLYGHLEEDDVMARTLEQYPVGGLVFFSKNIETPEQLSAFTAHLQESSPIPLFLAIDEEGGRVARIARDKDFDVPRYESAAAVGQTGDPDQAREMGYAIGSYLTQYGFNLNFAPVADVWSNPENTVIGDRAFSAQPEETAQMVLAALEGYHQAGVMTTLKHFPGHGDTLADSHQGEVTLSKSWEELLETELVPFRAALGETDLVMAAHIHTPNVTSDGLPASLSYEMLTLRLRGELGYEGVIITDSLSMGAITEGYSSAESCLLALEAGADLLLMPADFAGSFEAICQAVEEGRISRARLEESVLRVLELKERYGLLQR